MRRTKPIRASRDSGPQHVGSPYRGLPHLAATYFFNQYKPFTIFVATSSWFCFTCIARVDKTRRNYCFADDDPAIASGDCLIRSRWHGPDDGGIRNGARGYIPTGSMTVAIAVEAIHLLRAGGIFVSPSSLKMINYPLSTRDSTPQGKSNEVILDEIQMSESTVMGLSATL